MKKSLGSSIKFLYFPHMYHNLLKTHVKTAKKLV